jgi:hypothetical protein
MAYTWTWRDGAPLYLSTEAGTLTLSFAGTRNFSFDAAGRLLGAWFHGVTYRRGLDNRVLAKWLRPGGLRSRRLLDADERRNVIETAYTAASDVAVALSNGALCPANTPDEQVAAIANWLNVVGAWTWEGLEQHAAAFHTIYKPVSILPPDQYLSMVLQATEGCSYNRCTFCTFYRDRPFRIKRGGEFADHCRRVAEFLGAGISVRRSIFLADANAVIIAQSALVPLLETAHAYFRIDGGNQRSVADRVGRFDGIYAFISAPDALRKTADDFSQMAALGVRRLYVGLETGYDPLRRFLAKPGTADHVLAAVQTIKTGGVAVGIIAMVGAGGERYRDDHRRATLALIQAMPLDHRDLVYLSPFVDEEPSPYREAAAALALTPLDDDAIRDEVRRFKGALAPWAKPRGLRVSNYDVHEFIY